MPGQQRLVRPPGALPITEPRQAPPATGQDAVVLEQLCEVRGVVPDQQQGPAGGDGTGEAGVDRAAQRRGEVHVVGHDEVVGARDEDHRGLGMQVDPVAADVAARHAICAVLEPWFAARSLAEVRQLLDGTGVLWGPYQDFGQLVTEDARCSTANPMFAEIDQPGIGRVLTPRIPLSLAGTPGLPPSPAPVLGQDSAAVLADVLGYSDAQLAGLRDRKILAG